MAPISWGNGLRKGRSIEATGLLPRTKIRCLLSKNDSTSPENEKGLITIVLQQPVILLIQYNLSVVQYKDANSHLYRRLSKILSGSVETLNQNKPDFGPVPYLRYNWDFRRFLP